MVSTRVRTSPTLAELAPSWNLALDAQNKAAKTLEAYLGSLDQFSAFLDFKGMSQHIASLRREHVEAFIAHILTVAKPATASVRYRALQQFFKWAVEEGEIKADPMSRMKPPRIPESPPPMPTEDDLRALLKASAGQDFEGRRDTALIRLFLDSGARRSEIAGLALTDVDWELRVIRVVGKGRRERGCPFGKKTAAALDRYVRARRQHPHAERREFWVGHAGPLTSNGIYQILKRRAAQAGIELHPHLFRHHFAHEWLAAGGQESDLMMLTGWRSRSMLQRYAASAAAERARAAHNRFALGDKL